MQGMQKLPVKMLPSFSVKKVASSANPIVLLIQSGSLYTLRNSEQGQHGYVRDCLSFWSAEVAFGRLAHAC
jgi:alpha-tubulin suppressor-like RCC1 family protein